MASFSTESYIIDHGEGGRGRWLQGKRLLQTQILERHSIWPALETAMKSEFDAVVGDLFERP